jgi:unsaturated chondroitin disaccharide hydrolase
MSQVITLDTSDGEIIDVRTGEQGLAADSTWSRSQAWGLLAAATGAARCPHRAEEFLLHAHAIAEYWIARCGSANSRVPRWDFDAEAGPIDTSAAAIAATALLRLAAVIASRSAHEAVGYRGTAERTLSQLCRHVTPTSPDDRRPPGMLVDGCYHYPHRLAIADELVWGDYYLLEACLTALGGLDPLRL